MALGSTQPLADMRIRSISRGIRWPVRRADKPCHFHVPIVLKSGILNLLEPSGPFQACTGIAYLYLYHISPTQCIYAFLLVQNQATIVFLNAMKNLFFVIKQHCVYYEVRI